ncbi:MAG TPA: enoyl-CoA hydratase-related protein [Candidatus Kapabacteria bacterium]|nr:enoyl-CoA hydratase-related protein [Candidatus Kapabacteria bacterium]
MEQILYATADGVATITLNRPEKRNALDEQMIRELHSAVEKATADAAIRVIVLTGNGDAFCAGADLAYLRKISEYDIAANKNDSHNLMELLYAIHSSPKPTVAVVRGPALAGGCGLATVCDITIASADATFGYPEVRIGFIPAIVMVFLREKLGEAMAKNLVLRGRVLGADEACRIGLIAHAVPTAEVGKKTEEIIVDLKRGSSSALRLAKQMFAALPGMPITAGLEYASMMNALARQTEDCKRGIEQFLSKKEKGTSAT